jgi:hypothetical protein
MEKKRYLTPLIPFVFCGALSIIYNRMEPKDYPDPSYPYRTQGALDYLSANWFLIGIVISILFLIIVLVEDAFSAIGKHIEKRRQR